MYYKAMPVTTMWLDHDHQKKLTQGVAGLHQVAGSIWAWGAVSCASLKFKTTTKKKQEETDPHINGNFIYGRGGK